MERRSIPNQPYFCVTSKLCHQTMTGEAKKECCSCDKKSAPGFRLASIVGLIGVAITLIAYFLLHAEWSSNDDILFAAMNIVGSGCILFSLFHEWNLAAGVMEICWLAISVAAVVKITASRHKRGFTAGNSG